MSSKNEALNPMSTDELTSVTGGKQMYVDGILMEVSGTALRGLLNAASAVVIKGIEPGGTGGVNW